MTVRARVSPLCAVCGRPAVSAVRSFAFGQVTYSSVCAYHRDDGKWPPGTLEVDLADVPALSLAEEVLSS